MVAVVEDGLGCMALAYEDDVRPERRHREDVGETRTKYCPSAARLSASPFPPYADYRVSVAPPSQGSELRGRSPKQKSLLLPKHVLRLIFDSTRVD